MSGQGPPIAAEWIGRLASAAEFLRRRAARDYGVDAETAFDPELNRAVLMPAARALYKGCFRVQMRGLEHVPSDGSALISPNHSGVPPRGAVMLQVGIFDEPPGGRNWGLLGAEMVSWAPLLGGVARASGHVPAKPAEAERLLRAGELVGVFPEGFKGIGKPFSDRYQLQRFGRGGLARTALRTGVPPLPVAVVGAEEIHPLGGELQEVGARAGGPH